jgi:DHA1 family tetracycline resistance protein-like MFS transporter
VCATVFVDLCGFGIILPSLPFHVQDLGGSAGWIGLLLTSYAAAQMIASPVLGAFSDRYGRRRILLLSLLGSALSMSLSAAAGSLGLLLAARALAGAFGGTISVAQAFATDLAPPEERTKSLGLVGAAIGMGFVAGPAIGAGLHGIGLGFAGSCLVAAGMALANLAVASRTLPASVTSNTPIRPDWGRRFRGVVSPAPVAVFLYMVAFVGMETTLAVLAGQRYGFGPGQFGMLLAAVGVAMAVVQGTLVGPLNRRYGRRALGVAGAALLAAGLGPLPFVPMWLALVCGAVFATGYGLLSTATASLIADSAPDARGAALGVGQSASALARVVGPLAAGLAFDLTPAAAYLGGAALCVVAGLIVVRVDRPALHAPVADIATATGAAR